MYHKKVNGVDGVCEYAAIIEVKGILIMQHGETDKCAALFLHIKPLQCKASTQFLDGCYFIKDSPDGINEVHPSSLLSKVVMFLRPGRVGAAVSPPRGALEVGANL